MSAAGDTYFEHMADLLAGTLRASRALSERALRHARAGGGWPAVLALGAVRAEIRYARTGGGRARSGGTGMRLLGAWERPRDAIRRPTAELTLRLGLAPALEGHAEALVHPALELAAPAFLAQPGAAALQLRLADGATLVVDFPGPGKLRLAGVDLTLFGGDGFGPEYQGDTLADWPVAALVAVLDTLAAWGRAGEPRRLLPFVRPADGGGLARWLADLARGYGEIARLLATQANPAESAPPTGSPALTLDSLEADARLLQDDAGDPLEDEAEPNRQRVDMLARLRWAATGPVISLVPRFTDIAVAGALLAAFLPDLRRQAAVDALWAGLARGHDSAALDFHALPEVLGDWSRARLAAYLGDPAHDAGALLTRLRHDDTDLVLLGGTAAEPGVRLLAQITRGKPGSARLVALRAASGVWIAGDESLAPRYFYRLFQTLCAWQSGLGAA